MPPEYTDRCRNQPGGYDGVEYDVESRKRRRTESRSSGSGSGLMTDGKRRKSPSLSGSRRSPKTHSFFRAVVKRKLDRKVLRNTLYEFVRNIVKRQPPVAPSSRSDDAVFADLKFNDKLDVCRVHSVTGEDSVLRCYAAVRFLRSLDRDVLDVLDDFIQQDKSPSRGS